MSIVENKDFSLINKGQTVGCIQPVENYTNKNDFEVIIDWFQVTVFPKQKYYKNVYLDREDVISSDNVIFVMFKELFEIESNMIIKEIISLNGYDTVYSYKDILIMRHSQRDDMGINILLRGQGCRDFEELDIPWQRLFNRIIKYDINFNRIDIAIDTFTDKYFTIDLLNDYIIAGACASKFKTSLEIVKRNLQNGKISHGHTLQFGSKASELEITFYDKLLERKNAGFIVDRNIKFWLRTELRFRHEYAKELFDHIDCHDDYTEYVKSILYYYIDFKTLDSADTNKSRRPTAFWWNSFLNDSSKLKLSPRSSERRISRIYNWLLQSTSRSSLLVYFSMLPNISVDKFSSDLLLDLLRNGEYRIKDKDMVLINDYRISKHLPIITKKQILDYVQDLKYVILYDDGIID